mmetsp:Transcript_8254/g.20797  ORF Transcript_8254/g.20797 Transcript_8254/m.20797 type:complete len:346 (+) Transcript_8254:195-1232(+)
MFRCCLAPCTNQVDDDVTYDETPEIAKKPSANIMLPTPEIGAASPKSDGHCSDVDASNKQTLTPVALSPTAPTSVGTSLQFIGDAPRSESDLVERPVFEAQNSLMVGTSTKGTQADDFVPEAETLAIQKLENATAAAHIWVRDSMCLWRAMPIGDSCDGLRFLEGARTVSRVYTWVFHMAYATKYLTNDLQENIAFLKKKWPPGALTPRDVVRWEVSAIGVKGIESKYWNTCTVRILWIVRALRMHATVMESLATKDASPVTLAKDAVSSVLGPYLNWMLQKVAGYIVSCCVWTTQEKLFTKLQVPPEETKRYLNLLYPILLRSIVPLEDMLLEEVPTVVAKKAA